MGPFFLPISILQHSLTYLASIMPKWKSKVLSGFKTSQPMSDIRKLWWLFWKWFIMLKLAKHLFSNKHRLFWLRVIWMQQLIVHLTFIFFKYFVRAFVFISTKDVQNKEIKRTISFSILVNWKKKSITLIQNNLYFQGQIKPFLKKCMNMEKKILH